MTKLFSIIVGLSAFGLFYTASANPTTPQPAPKTKKFAGSDLSIEGELRNAIFSRVAFKSGKIVFLGKEYKIVTTSRYGSVGAAYVGNNANLQEFVYFTSSYVEPISVGNSLPWMAADKYSDCTNTSYNTVVVVYDVTGSKIVDKNKMAVDINNPLHVKKKLFPALARSVDNSTSATGYCRTIK